MGKWFKDSFRLNSYLGYLAILRILVGYHFLSVGWEKLSRGFYLGQMLPQMLSHAANDPIGLHRAFIEHFVLPHMTFFSYLVPFGETAIGIALITGCLVRVASLFGALENLNILLVVSIPTANGAQIGLNRLFVFLHIIFVLASAGSAIGVDGLLMKRFPNSWLFGGRKYSGQKSLMVQSAVR